MMNMRVKGVSSLNYPRNVGFPFFYPREKTPIGTGSFFREIFDTNFRVFESLCFPFFYPRQK